MFSFRQPTLCSFYSSLGDFRVSFVWSPVFFLMACFWAAWVVFCLRLFSSLQFVAYRLFCQDVRKQLLAYLKLRGSTLACPKHSKYVAKIFVYSSLSSEHPARIWLLNSAQNIRQKMKSPLVYTFIQLRCAADDDDDNCNFNIGYHMIAEHLFQ